MSFYGWSEDYVTTGITGAQGWAYYAYAIENEASVWGTGTVRKSDGYVRQEIKRRGRDRH